MSEKFNFDNVIAHYGLEPKFCDRPAHGQVQSWVESLIGAGCRWAYVAAEDDCLLLRASDRVTACHIDFAYTPDGELIYDDRGAVSLAGDEYLDLGVFFPEAERRTLAIFPPGDYGGIHINVPFLTGEVGQPVVIEFIEPVRYVQLTFIPTLPYLLHVFRDDEENVVTYRDLRLHAETTSDRSDINRIAFGHALPLIAVESLYFER